MGCFMFSSLPTVKNAWFVISRGCHRTLLVEYQEVHCPTTSCFGMPSYLVQVGCPILFSPSLSSPYWPNHPSHIVRRYPIRRRHIQASPNIWRILSQQTSHRQIPVSHVPSQRLRQRRALSWHPSKPMESYLWRSRHFDEYTEFIARSESEQSC